MDKQYIVKKEEVLVLPTRIWTDPQRLDQSDLIEVTQY